MEPESPLQSLPRRQYDQPVKLQNYQRKKVLTNFFEIKFGNKDNVVYQFVFDAQPQLPQDSKELLYQLIKSIRKELKQKLGFVTASGLMIWGVKNLNIPLSIKTQFKYQDKDYKFDVIIKPTKSLDVPNLLKTKQGAKMVFQIFNNKIKGVLRDRKMDEITPGKYFDKKQVKVEEIGLNILRGYKFTLSNLKSGMCLQIDVCSRVFRAANLLEEINRLPKDQIQSLVGSTVITRYGRIRTYTILKIDYSITPKSQFFHQKRQGKVTFAKYYEESYGLKIKQMNQPLIEVILRTQKVMNKQGKLEKKQARGFLVPQFVSLTGMSDQQKANYQTMKQIAPYTKLTPDERLKQTCRLIDSINGNQFQVGRPILVDAFQLNDPEALLGGKNTFQAKDGSLNFRDRVKERVDFKDWAVVYSVGQNPKYDDGDADNLVSLINQASQAYQLKFTAPGFVTCDSNIKSWKAEIQNDIEKNGKPLIIVLFLNPKQQKFYGELKRFITCQLKIPCQGIRRRTVSNKAKSALSAASKIIIQMNQKVGGQAWQIKRNGIFSKKKIMYGAFSMSKGKKGFTLAFVGSTNSENTKVFNYSKVGYKRKEDIPQQDFQTIFLNWAKNYVQQNKVGPDVIIIYRQGLSIPQIEVQLKVEIDSLNGVIKKVGDKTKKPNYRPQVLYVTVNKKINTRFFDTLDKVGSQGKFIPKVNNPSSGTCLFDSITVDNLFDFHLSAQKVTQGTCTPTHYIVVYNDSKISQQELAQFTYDQCFSYFNWQGAVKVPANLQCADKLAKLVGESIQSNVTQGEVIKSFYFL